MKKTYSLGIIGLSPGNGHPYSWAAIFNGYDKAEMAECPFPVIPEYLGKQDPATLRIREGKVTHIWTQDPQVSRKVAAASLIENAVERAEEMIGKVDAVLLARDDGENHLTMARPFIEAGVPIFIDKPLTDRADDLKEFVRYYREGRKILSCSSARFAGSIVELREKNNLGRILTAVGVTPKYWRTYGIHIIEGIYAVMGGGIESVRNVGARDRDIVHLKYRDGRSAVIQAFAEIKAGSLTFYGEKGMAAPSDPDSFSQFKAMLQSFIGMLQTGAPPFDWHQTVEMAEVVIAGTLSRDEGGREVHLAEIEAAFTPGGTEGRRQSKSPESQPADLTEKLYLHAKDRMPGGVQLLSKRPEMMAPDQWPAYFREARGCECWDLDGRHYYDMSYNGISACLLGFRDPSVTAAVLRRISRGSMCTLNPPEEVELADRLCELHPWASQVRFGRSGGEIAAVAVRIARATTDRSAVAICGYHGWHDWYLAANLGESDALRGHLLPGLAPLGVPRELRGTAFPFTYNNREAFQQIVDRQGGRLAAVIMEPCRYHDPEPGFLEFVRDAAHKCGALLIFDEITIGWRLHFGGSHLKLRVNPDLAIFAKAMGNGHPVAAVVGTREAMAGAHDSFISSTYWTESVGPVAALATIKRMSETDVPAYVAAIGAAVQKLWTESAARHRLPVKVDDGYPCLPHFRFDHPLAEELRTLYTQLMLPRGFLATAAFSPTLAHNEEIISLYGRAADEVFGEIARILEQDRVKESLAGPVAHTGFRRLL